MSTLRPTMPRASRLPPGARQCGSCASSATNTTQLIVAALLAGAAVSASQDALLALWFKMLAEAVLKATGGRCASRRSALGVSARPRRGSLQTGQHRDAPLPRQVTIALEAHIGNALASMRRTRSDPTPLGPSQSGTSCSTTYMSLFSTSGEILRLAVTIAFSQLLIPPRAAGVALVALQPGPQRGAPRSNGLPYERGAASARSRVALFDMATTASPGKEVRVTGIANQFLIEQRRGACWERSYAPIAAAR